MVQRNRFLKRPENISIAMLGDNEADTRNMGVTKVPTLCKQIAEDNKENKSQGSCSKAPKSSTVRVFYAPILNLKANKYYQLIDIATYEQQPPAIEKLTTIEIRESLVKPFEFISPLLQSNCGEKC